MKRTTRFFLLGGIFSCCLSSAAAQPAALKLRYEQPAQKWTEALPLGNGRIGAMIFGGVERDRIQFNEETLWTGRPRDYNRPGASRYLDSIRQLLFAGKQKQAEELAAEKFMGMQSDEGNREAWIKKVSINTSPSQTAFDDAKWKTMHVPSYEGWEAVGFEGLDGAVWVRTNFTVPAHWAGKRVVLDLNRIRDQDYTYVNGKLIGSMTGNDPRKYIIPKEIIKAGVNNISILVLNFFDKGGLAGYKDTTRPIGVYLEEEGETAKRPLNGKWKYFIVDDNPPAVPHYQADYQPFGDLGLDFQHTADQDSYKRELDLATATALTTYAVGGIIYKREYLISQPDQLLAVHLSASQDAMISFTASLSTPHKQAVVRKVNDNTISLLLNVKNGALWGQAQLRMVAKGGAIAVKDAKITVANADDVLIYLVAATNFKNYHDVSGDPVGICNRQLEAAKTKTFEQIAAAHRKEYQGYFNTFSISLGGMPRDHLPTDKRLAEFVSSNDPSFVALYLQYGRYLLIASSRPGTQPANLQGIWNELLAPPWGSKYTTNINAEMNYWPAELLNLSPMHEPLFRMIDELSKTGAKTARTYYHAPGWVVHHNTDLWRGAAPINASNHGIWVTGGGWLAHHLWEHYLFTQDVSFLKNKAYPLMKQAALFFNAFLVKDPVTGRLISTPSNSPEQGGLVAGPTMDHQIIRDLFNNMIAASTILKTDQSLRDTLKKRLALIAPNQVGKYGQLQEWMEDKDDTTNKHRHVSHLWGVHPGAEINWDQTPELMKAARQSLIYRGDAATGWSLGWKINLWARFKEGDHAFKLIRMLISPVKGGAGSYPNLFDAHPPFQIDGNFGGAAGIGEMLVQSHTRFIDLLPALPAALPDGEVKGICARGGFVLNIGWAQGKLVKLTIISTAGKTALLRYDGKELLLNTQAGETYSLNGNLEKI